MFIYLSMGGLPLKFLPFQHNVRHKNQCYDIFQCLIMYFDLKNTLIISRVNINCLMYSAECALG